MLAYTVAKLMMGRRLSEEDVLTDMTALVTFSQGWKSFFGKVIGYRVLVTYLKCNK